MVAIRELPPSPQERYPLSLQSEGKVSEWFQALQQKKQWVTTHDPRADTLQIELDLAGGGMQGVMHVGLLSSLQERGLLEVIDRIVGVSTGALAAIAAIGGDHEKARDAYLTVAMHGIVNPRRIPFRDAVNLERLYILLGSLIDREKIRNAHTQLSSIVTDAITGEAREIDMTHHPDPLAVAIASSAVPGLTKSPVALSLPDGQRAQVVDGMVSSPYPKSQLHTQQMTHRLVAVPCPPGIDMPWFYRSVIASDPRLVSYGKCRRAIWQLNAAGKKDLHAIRTAIDHGDTVGMVFPEQVLDTLSQNWLNHLRPYQVRATAAYGELIDRALRM